MDAGKDLKKEKLCIIVIRGDILGKVNIVECESEEVEKLGMGTTLYTCLLPLPS